MEIFVRFLSFLRACMPRSGTKVKFIGVVSRNIQFEDFFEFPLKFLKWISIDLTPQPKFEDLNAKQKRSILIRDIIPWLHMLNITIYVALIAYDTHLDHSNMFRVAYCGFITLCLLIIIAKLALLTIM